MKAYQYQQLGLTEKQIFQAIGGDDPRTIADLFPWLQQIPIDHVYLLKKFGRLILIACPVAQLCRAPSDMSPETDYRPTLYRAHHPDGRIAHDRLSEVPECLADYVSSCSYASLDTTLGSLRAAEAASQIY